MLLLLLGVISHLGLGQAEPEDSSIRGNEGAGEPELQEPRMPAEYLVQVQDNESL